jgi:hypothetical protein
MELSVADIVERVVTTFLQAAVAYALVTPLSDDRFAEGLLVVLIIAAANLVKIGLTTWVPTFTNWWVDAAYRVASTFVVSVAGSLVAIEWFDIVSMDFWKQVVGAAFAAALALLKAILAARRPNTVTPASLALAA